MTAQGCCFQTKIYDTTIKESMQHFTLKNGDCFHLGYIYQPLPYPPRASK